MKSWVFFVCVVGIFAFSLSTVVSICEGYRDRDKDKEFLLKSEILDGTARLYEHYPNGYKSLLCGGWGSGHGWHVFYENKDSFCYIRIDAENVFVLRRNPYNRFVVKIEVAGNAGMKILKKSISPTAESFSLVK